MKYFRNKRIALLTASGVVLLATTLKADFYSEYAEAYKVYEEAKYALDQKKYDDASLTFIEAKSKFNAICKRYPKKDISKVKRYIKACDSSVVKIKAEIKKIEEEKNANSLNTSNVKSSGSVEVAFLKESLLRIMLENKELNEKLKKAKIDIAKARRAPKNNGVKFTELMRVNGELEKRNTALAGQIVKLKEILNKQQSKSDVQKLIAKQTEINRLSEELKSLKDQNTLLKDATQKNSINKNSLEFEMSKLKRVLTKKDNELALLKKRLDKGAPSMTKLEDLEVLAEENFKLKAQVNNLKNKVAEQTKILEKTSKAVKNAKNEAKLFNENKVLKQKNAELAKDLKFIRVKQAQQSRNSEFDGSKIKALEKKLSELKKELTTEKNKKRNVSTEELEKAQKEVAFNKKVYAALYKDNNDLKKKLANYGTLEGKVTTLTAEKIAVNKKMNEVVQLNSKLKNDLLVAQQKITKVKKLEDTVQKIKVINEKNSNNYSKAIQLIKKLKAENEALSNKLKNASQVGVKKVEAKQIITPKLNATDSKAKSKVLIINKGLARAVNSKNNEAILWHCIELLKVENSISNKYLVIDTLKKQNLTKNVPKELIKLLNSSSKGVVLEDVKKAVEQFNK